ncbi:thioesterase family protein [Mycena galericulata]|nr:thioesterase family protein [Mycena galericulata]
MSHPSNPSLEKARVDVSVQSNTDTNPASASDEPNLFNNVQTVLTNYLTSSPLYNLLLSTLVLVSASNGRVTLKLVVLPVHVNSKSVLHGSISAALVDLVAGLAITSTGSPKTGLSTDLHVSFAGAARQGDTLWIEGFAERVGGTLAFTRVRIEKESEGDTGRTLVATGSHTKYVR